MLPLRELVSRVRLRGSKHPSASNNDLHERLLRAEMADVRNRLRRDWQVHGLSGAARAGAERAIQNVVRHRFKSANRGVTIPLEQQLMLLRGIRASSLLDHLYPERNQPNGWTKLRQRDLQRNERIDLQDFSLLDDPRSTIAGLQRIAQAEAQAVEARIDFKDSYCLDVSPFMLLMECWGQMLPVFEGGRMGLPMQKVLVSLGIPQAMGISVRGVSELNDVWAFPLCRRRGAGSSASKAPFTDVQTREIAIDEFCDALNKWLSEIGVELNAKGVGWIKLILGELLENAERHGDGGRRDGAWSVSGCMVRRKDDATGDWVFRVYIGIVNFGDTFAKTLDRALPEIQTQLSDYIADMRIKGAPQSPSTLRTLAALQDTITCVSEADEDDRGGFGLQDMLEFVDLVGHTRIADRKPRVTIVSGSSCIQLRDPYIVGARTKGPGTPRVLWCNESNRMSEPPDERFVYDLDAALPGTAISIGFILDRDYYERVRSAGGNDADDRSSEADGGSGA